MDKPITFGKFQGWTPLELARAGEIGRNYLAWGRDNLKSPQWRRAFEMALKANVRPDVYLAAKVLQKDCPDLDLDDAIELVKGEIAQAEENDAMLQAIEERQVKVVSHWAEIMNVDVPRLRSLARMYEFSEWDQLPANHFSSPQMAANFKAFMAAWVAAYAE